MTPRFTDKKFAGKMPFTMGSNLICLFNSLAERTVDGELQSHLYEVGELVESAGDDTIQSQYERTWCHLVDSAVTNILAEAEAAVGILAVQKRQLDYDIVKDLVDRRQHRADVIEDYARRIKSTIYGSENKAKKGASKQAHTGLLGEPDDDPDCGKYQAYQHSPLGSMASPDLPAWTTLHSGSDLPDSSNAAGNTIATGASKAQETKSNLSIHETIELFGTPPPRAQSNSSALKADEKPVVVAEAVESIKIEAKKVLDAVQEAIKSMELAWSKGAKLNDEAKLNVKANLDRGEDSIKPFDFSESEDALPAHLDKSRRCSTPVSHRVPGRDENVKGSVPSAPAGSDDDNETGWGDVKFRSMDWGSRANKVRSSNGWGPCDDEDGASASAGCTPSESLDFFGKTREHASRIISSETKLRIAEKEVENLRARVVLEKAETEVENMKKDLSVQEYTDKVNAFDEMCEKESGGTSIADPGRWY